MTHRPVIGSAVALCAIVVSTGCRPTAEPEEARPSESSGATEEAEAEETDREELFGMPVPDGAELEESGESFAHYNLPGSFDDVVAHYEDALTGYRVVEYAEGVKFEPRDGSGRSLYVLEGEGDDDVMVTYFDEEVAVASNAVADSPTDATRVGQVPGTTESSAAGRTNGGGSTLGGSTVGGAGAASRGNSGDYIGADGIQRRVQPRSNAPERGTTNPLGRRPINFTGVFEPPRNPNAYY